MNQNHSHHHPYRITSNHQAGFTLVEVIVSISILSMIMAAIVGLQGFMMDQQQFAMNSFLSVDSANRNVETMVRNIRNARMGDNGAYPLDLTNDQEISFYTDVDSDGAVEKVRYFLSGTELQQGIIDPTGYPITYPAATEKVTTLTEYVRNGTNPIFRYYNGDWPTDVANNPLSAPNRQQRTRLIEINLSVNSNPEVLTTNYDLHSYADIRMLKDNL